MPLSITTAPNDEPITQAEAKAHIRIDHADEDGVIDTMRYAARSAVETFLQSALLPTVYNYTLDGFPPEITLPIGPVLQAGDVAIAYVDDAGATKTLAATEYQVSPGNVTRIRPAYSKTWPTTRRQFDAVTVTFTAGNADAASIPKAIKAALLLTFGDFYEKREAGEIPIGARNLLMPFIGWR